MKKKTNFFLLLCVFCFSNCSKDLIEERKLLPNKSNQLAAGADGDLDLLGYGIDITKDLSGTSTQNGSTSDVRIFDMSKFRNNQNRWIDINGTTHGYDYFISGVTAYDYSRDYSEKKSSSLAIGISDPPVTVNEKPNFTQTIKSEKNYEDQTINKFSTRYSYATFELVHQIKRIRFTQDVTKDSLIKALTPEFLTFVQNNTAQAIVNRYGTHILLDISIGGILRINTSGDVSSQSTNELKSSHIKTGLSLNVFKVLSIDKESNKTLSEKTQINQEIRVKQSRAIYFGGTNSGRSFSIDKDGNSSENFNASSWQSSINDRNAALISIGRAAYIYDFIADPVKRNQVKLVVENHIENHQIQLHEDYTIQLINILSFVAKAGQHHYLATSMVNDLNYWRYEGSGFKAFKTQIPGTVPVKVYASHLRSSHYFTTGVLNSTNTDMNFWKWQDEGVSFYAYSSQIPGTIPIYEHYSPSGTDHYYNPQSNKGLNNNTYWKDIKGPVFYAYPANYYQ
ncbi:MAC/perforin domain-containing protein [Sphingobacterium sp. SGL-16]|uniref:MAC/perforin domain-containing protein n=1 Tax=Sphingobacterium sp. SGL-16 TaxID=2710883 RepID=UPI0013ED6877|nr:MAC/perforin domain-containing protein [Sphingobacterium sp. SGL-16]NGM71693.1 hypothetical protein [Sphingobacterium sp. SGL-16]